MTRQKAPFFQRKWKKIKMRYYAYRNPEKLLRMRYREHFGADPDLETPQTRNEKVLWMMLHADTSRWTQLADKYRVREYVEQCGLGWMLNELYAAWTPGEWERADPLDDPRLPDSFVLKANNGYGDITFVYDRKTADKNAVRHKMARALKRKFGRMSGELHYLGIEPCIIAEKLLTTDRASLIDYKFYCFDGEPRYCVVVYDHISPASTTEELYEAHSWEDLNHKILGFDKIPRHRYVPRPKSLDRMLDAARRLAAGFQFVRIDLYEIDGNPVFGEMTFTPASGMDKTYGPEFQRELGALINLPPKTR